MRVLILFVAACSPPASVGRSPGPPEVLGHGWLDTAATGGVEGQVRTSRREERYLLHGRTPADLLADLQQRRPRDERFTGWTRWRLKWRFEPDDSDGSCEVAAADVDLKITTVLPSWEPPVDAQPSLVAAWDAYVRALEAHESGHARLAAEAADRIQRALLSLPARATCADLRERANELGQNEVQRLRIANASFDAHTQHGASQGAIFPGPGHVAGMP